MKKMSNIIFAILNSSDFKEDNVLYCGVKHALNWAPLLKIHRWCVVVMLCNNSTLTVETLNSVGSIFWANVRTPQQ